MLCCADLKDWMGRWTELKMSIWSWSVVYLTVNIITDYQSMPSPLEMYSKFVLPNWRLLSHILKWVRKWPVIDHCFELWWIWIQSHIWSNIRSLHHFRNIKWLCSKHVNTSTCMVVDKSVINFSHLMFITCKAVLY